MTMTGSSGPGAASRNQSDRQRGSLRRALNPVSFSDQRASHGTSLRKFISHGTFAA